MTVPMNMWMNMTMIAKPPPPPPHAPEEYPHPDRHWTTVHATCSITPHHHNDDNYDEDRSKTTMLQAVWESHSQHSQHRIAIYRHSDAITTSNTTTNTTTNTNDNPPMVSLSLPVTTSTVSPPPPPPLNDPDIISRRRSTSSSITTTNASVLVWTRFSSFSSRQCPVDTVVCCLSNPQTITIWNVVVASSSFSQDHNNNNNNDNNDTMMIPPEGWTVTLPFDCRAIYPLPSSSTSGGGGGLLLQRQSDAASDVALWHHTTTAATTTTTPPVDDDDNDQSVVLLQPPSTWRQHQLPPPLPSNTMMRHDDDNNDDDDPPLVHPPHPCPGVEPVVTTAPPVVSLFTWHHPLEEVIPVVHYHHNNNNNNNMNGNNGSTTTTTTTTTTSTVTTDTLEHILWVGTAAWSSNDEEGEDPLIQRRATTTTTTDTRPTTTIRRPRRHHHQTVVVTYHTVECRHAIHVVTSVPPSTTTTQTGAVHDPHPIMLTKLEYDEYGPPRDMTEFRSMDDDDDDTSTPLMMPRRTMIRDPEENDDSWGPTKRWDHHVALADALGVTPPVPFRVASSPRPGRGNYRINNNNNNSTNSSTSGGGGGGVGTNQGPRTTRNEFFAPSSLGRNSSQYRPNTMDTTTTTTTTAPPPAPTNGFFPTKLTNALHARTAITCLYQESAATAPATTVCLISNNTATGTLVLAMLRGDQTLVFYSLIPTSATTTGGGIVQVQLLSRLPSVRAMVPIAAVPHPHQYRRRRRRRATDLLLVRSESGRTTTHCQLYRSDALICECQVADPDGVDGMNFRMSGLSDPVLDTYTVHFQDPHTKRHAGTIRCQLSLTLETTSALTERVLSCLDAALYGASNNNNNVNNNNTSNTRCIPLALKLRIDCHRFYDAIMPEMERFEAVPTPERLLFDILQFVMVQVLHQHLDGGTARPPATTKSSKTSLVPSDWDALLTSDFHQSYSPDLQFHMSYAANNKDKGDETRASQIASILQNVQDTIGSLALQEIQENEASWNGFSLFSLIFDSLHLLYEDTKLSAACLGFELSSLAGVLIELTTIMKERDDSLLQIANAFLEYYQSENESEKNYDSRHNVSMNQPKAATSRNSITKWTSFTAPPSIFRWTRNVLNNAGTASFNCGTYGNCSDWSTMNSVCFRTRLVLQLFPCLIMSIHDSTALLRFVQTLLEAGFTNDSMIREEFCPGIALPLLEVLYRCRNAAECANLPGWSAKMWMLVGRRDLAMNSNPSKATTYTEADGSLDVPSIDDTKDELNDGLSGIERSAAIIFPEDNRVHEAARLLRSSRPIFLRVARAVEVSDHDFERLKQNRLLVLSYRVLALPTGRGMLTIGRFRPISTEPLPIPALCLKGRVPPTYATITLDTSECPTGMQVWPEFHNGVAAGLRLPVKNDTYHPDFTIPRTWILYNRPALSRTPAPTQQDGGDEANTNPQTQSYSHGGFLLALGLRGHLAALDMSDVYEYLTQGCATTTVGVLLGMAANKRGTCDLSISKMLCLHIPSLIPQHFSAIDVASIVQTSAIVGAGLLFQGSSHRMMTEFLLNEIGKRPDADINTSDRESYTLACGLALGTVNLCLGEAMGTDSKRLGVADLHIEERLIRYIIGGIDKNEVDRTRESNDRFSLPNLLAGSDNEKCSTIYESNRINTSVTSPGATLALGLMYMKTNNKEVAESLNLPDTHFLLEFVRPDFLGYRVISRTLILWDEVDASRKWIDEQVPKVVLDAYEQIGAAAKAAYTARWPTQTRNNVEQYDRRAVKQLYIHVVSSACFAMGLRFAGTGHPDAKKAILGVVLEFHNLREATDPVSVAVRPEMSILESCLGCAAIALAMVLAGTGDLDALRIFKILRWRCDNDCQYGIHMIFGMCVGLLFLGGGTCTLGRDPTDIAALITAFFPRFPVTTADNQYHLQALRHLYALAVKRTELRAIDVDTNESVQVPIQISLSDSTIDKIGLRVPCLLRNSGSPNQVLQVLTDNYFPCKLDLSEQNGIYSFFIQRRYTEQREGFATCSMSNIVGSGVPHMSANAHPYLQAFATYFQDDFVWKRPSFEGGEHQAMDRNFIALMITTCRKSDCAEDVLPIYLKLWYGMYQLSSMDEVNRTNFLWNLRLLHCYYMSQQARSVASLLDEKLLLPYIFECTVRLAASHSNSLAELL